jgi:hypothetical protein
MRTVARDGWTKADVRAFLFEHARNSIEYLRRTERLSGPVQPGDAERMRPIVERADDILVVAAGGRAGAFSAYVPGWSSRRSCQAVTREIRLRP